MKRKRHQEFKRKLREAVATAEVEIEREQVITSTNPLDDVFWRERERWAHDPDDDCYRYCPHYPPEEVDQEVADYLARPRTHASHT